jgi:group I intron endonuclease
MIGIYKITSPSNRVYIGQSKNILKRWKTYKYLLNKPYISQRKLANSFKKYGIELHLFEVVEETTLEQLNERELYWQNHHNTINKGLNSLTVKDGSIPQRMSTETVEKMKISRNTKIHKQKVSKQIKDLHSKGIYIQSYENKKKTVYQFDIEGNFIKEWRGIVEIINTISEYKSSNLKSCLSKRAKSAYGYQWSYTKDCIKLKLRKNRQTPIS